MLFILRKVDGFGCDGSFSSILRTKPEKTGLRDEMELLPLPLLPLLLLVPTLSCCVCCRRHRDIVLIRYVVGIPTDAINSARASE